MGIFTKNKSRFTDLYMMGIIKLSTVVLVIDRKQYNRFKNILVAHGIDRNTLWISLSILPPWKLVTNYQPYKEIIQWLGICEFRT